MKILALMGSPRKKGNTDILLDEFLRGLSNNNKNIEINKIVLQDKKIACCVSCNGCKMLKSQRCVVKDDMQQLYPLVKEADIIVFSTPIYWWSMSAQLKIFVDRLYGLGEKSSLKNKTCVLLTTYGGALPNEGPRLVEQTFREICGHMGMKLQCSYGVCTGEGTALSENSSQLKEVYELGFNITV